MPGLVNSIQAPPYADGLIGLTSGTYKNVTVILCKSDGGLDFIFESGNTQSVTQEAGIARTIAYGTSVTITSGIFDLA